MSATDMRDYLGDILGDHPVIAELAAKMQPPKGMQAYKKAASTDEMVYQRGAGKGKKKQGGGGRSPTPARKQLELGGGLKMKAVHSHADSAPSQHGAAGAAEPEEFNAHNKKGKSKRSSYVNIYSNEGSKVSQLVPGRVRCGCIAAKHGLINNCISCGRVVCKQEGVGPCMHCGELVVTPDQQEALQRDSNKSAKLRAKIIKEASRRAEQ